MIFAAPIFVLWFLPLALIADRVLPRRARCAGLLVMSLIFYGWWRVDFLFLLIGSTILDWGMGLWIDHVKEDRKRKLLVAISVLANLGVLCWFKYADFGIASFNSAIAMGASLLGLATPTPSPLLHIVLPIGISFYTFQSMSYVIDVYRRHVTPTKNFIEYAAFVSLFPQLVAGPIVRFRELEQGFRNPDRSPSMIWNGVIAFQLGLAKKVLIADTIAPIADRCFADGSLGFGDAWVGALAYTFQLYFDFSGYSDMAIGLGGMLGLRFPANFNAPYSANSITDFWRRWHISLSSWLRDYLYIPLGGNRGTTTRTYLNLVMTMLLGGLWHGANWTYVVWGAWHGTWLAVEKALGVDPLRTGWHRTLGTFLLVVIGWVFFRSLDLTSALTTLGVMFGMRGFSPPNFATYAQPEALAFIAAVLCTWMLPRVADIVKAGKPPAMIATSILFVIGFCHLYFQQYAPFLYFQF